MHISDFLSRHPDNEDSPNEIIPIAFMLQELETDKFLDHLLYLKEEVDVLPEEDNYVPYHEDDFMFLFSDDKYDNFSSLSELYSTESMRIESLNVCRESVEERTNVIQREISRTTFQLTLQTATLLGEKQLNIILNIKTSNLTFSTLHGERVTWPKMWDLLTQTAGQLPITSDQLHSYKVLYSVYIEYSLFLSLESGSGNRKSTKSAGNCKDVSILKPL